MTLNVSERVPVLGLVVGHSFDKTGFSSEVSRADSEIMPSQLIAEFKLLQQENPDCPLWPVIVSRSAVAHPGPRHTAHCEVLCYRAWSRSGMTAE